MLVSHDKMTQAHLLVELEGKTPRLGPKYNATASHVRRADASLPCYATAFLIKWLAASSTHFCFGLRARCALHSFASLSTLGPLNIRALEIFLGYASPC
jgi:hypothetical protein